MSAAVDVLHQPWTCRSFDAEACEEAIASYVSESNAVYFASTFLPEATPSPQRLLAAGHSTGQIRVFSSQALSDSWVTSRKPAPCVLAWQAHSSAVYSLAVLEQGEHSLLFSAGNDGCVRCWRVADIAAAAQEASAAAAAAAGPHQSGASNQRRQLAQVLPAAELQLPFAPSPLAVASTQLPAAQALVVAQQQVQLLVGASDGGCHMIDVQRWGSSSRSSSSYSGQVLSGHLAGVLDLDYCPNTQQLASASEDGSVRLWDLRGGSCTTAINIWDGEVLPAAAPSQQLRCLRNAYVSCVAFDPSGAWLMAGTGNASLTLWSTSLNVMAKQQSTDKCVPEALLFQPGELLMVGSEAALYRYPFSLEGPRKISLSASRCGFGMAAEQGTGVLAVAGSHGGLELLSSYGTKLGCAELGLPGSIQK